MFKALEKDPKDRFKSIQAFADALKGAYGSLNSQMTLTTIPANSTQSVAKQLIPHHPKPVEEPFSFENKLDITHLPLIYPQPKLLSPEEKAPISFDPILRLSSLSHQAQYPSMEELQPRPSLGENAVHLVPSEEIEEVDPRQEEALTVKYAIGKLNDYLGWFLIVLETALIIRFILKIIGADPKNLFAGFLYALTDILLSPFVNLVGSPSFHQNQYIEFSTLIAIGIYYLIFWALRWFLRVLISSPEEEE